VAVLAVVGRSSFGVGTVITVVFAGAVYVALGAIMVKLGWTPPSLMSREELAAAREARAAQAQARRDARKAPPQKGSTGKPTPPSAGTARPKPTPTKRTGGGTPPSRPKR
jgi:hypothetical protein